jgi:hypothetical protein
MIPMELVHKIKARVSKKEWQPCIIEFLVIRYGMACKILQYQRHQGFETRQFATNCILMKDTMVLVLQQGRIHLGITAKMGQRC